MQSIRNAIVSKLYDHLDMPIVPQDSNNPKPPYPYIAYKFIVPYTKARGQGNYSTDFVPSLDDRFEYDVEETLVTQPTMTLSISAYCKDEGDDYIIAYNAAKKVMDWFKMVGYQELSDINVVVVDIAAFGDRSTLIVNNYEQRIGLDIILRFTDVISRRFETIEEWNINTELE